MKALKIKAISEALFIILPQLQILSHTHNNSTVFKVLIVQAQTVTRTLNNTVIHAPLHALMRPLWHILIYVVINHRLSVLHLRF